MTYNPIPHRSTHDYRNHMRMKRYEQTSLNKTGNGNIRGVITAAVFIALLFAVPHIIGWMAGVL